jgi:hypothetical protein
MKKIIPIALFVYLLSLILIKAAPVFALAQVDSVDAVTGEVIVSGKGKLEFEKCSLFLRGECVGEELSMIEAKNLLQKALRKSLEEIGESDPEVVEKMIFDFRIDVVMAIRVRVDEVERGVGYADGDDFVFMYLIHPEKVEDLEVSLPKGDVSFSLVREKDEGTLLSTKRLFFEPK